MLLKFQENSKKITNFQTAFLLIALPKFSKSQLSPMNRAPPGSIQTFTNNNNNNYNGFGVPQVPIQLQSANLIQNATIEAPAPRNFRSIADHMTERLRFLDPAGSWSGTGGWQYTKVLEKIQQYGCYCFVDERFSQTLSPISLEGNKGTPVDEMDKLCLDLFRCHRCIYEFDYEGDTCEIESKYQSFFDDPTGQIECSIGNTPCQMSQCECDRRFVYMLADLWTNQDPNRETDYIYNRYYWKNDRNAKKGPTFGYRNTCVSNGNIGNSADACCGADGDRKPFNSNFASCCNDKLSTFGSC